MKEFWNTIQLIFAGVGGWLGYFLGGCDGLLYALVAFVVVDYITGVMCAAADKKLSSEVGFRGIVLDGELRETQTADYFSGLCPIDCAVLSVNA